MPSVGRYAPSPTGDLHVGNALAAVVAWARARQQRGLCRLRIEDLDTPRVKPGAAARMLEDLAALGLAFDGDVVWQSARGGAYDDALAALADAGLVYACSCSRKDLAASAPHQGDEGPVYPGTCRDKGLPLDAHDVALRVRVDRLVARFGAPVVVDGWQGAFAHDVERDVGDFIVKRKDGLYAYQLAVVVDDGAQGVTEVVRGQDLLSSAPRQVLLHQALSQAPPSFAHLPLLVDDDGHRLSKRSPQAPEVLRTLFSRGVTPARLLGHLLWLLGKNATHDDVDAAEFADALFAGGDDALAVDRVVWRAVD
jgi:glutamyl-Q tRNA(Asp) synthetase